MLRAGAYRRHIENRIRACNTPRPSLPGVTHSQRARPRTRRIRIRKLRVAGLLTVLAGIVVVGHPWPAKDFEPVTPTVGAPHHAALGEAGGAIPDGTTVFDDEVPGVAKLDGALLDALRQAASVAAGDGVRFVVDSGWRSRRYQAHLLKEAVSKYGSEAEAARWVATPKTSAHVSGDAVDIGPPEAASWLAAHGAQYGLCEVYGNEPWHYELRPDAVDSGCPPTYADPTHDPRMQQ
jgi:D-alanyl-D-alanine carboxypeptidase